jgi:hypothetical protein
MERKKGMKKHSLLLSVGITLLLALLSACDQPRVRPTIEPGGVLLSFERTGGIAGFMDKLVIGAGGAYHLSRRGQPERIGALSSEQRAQLDTWQQRFSAFTLTLEDNPGGPDNMKHEAIWSGPGKAAPTQAEQRQVLDWAATLLGELSAVKP